MEHKYKLDYHLIARRIKTARKNNNITQAELAERIGISTNAIAKLESNLMTASLQTLINISNELNIEIEYLFIDESMEDKKLTNVDIFLNSIISKLSQKDKEFIIHIINGLKIYRKNERH